MPETEQTTNRRVVGVLSAIYFCPSPDYDGRATTRAKTALRGEEIELTPDEEQRLEAHGALLPAGSLAGVVVDRLEKLVSDA